MRWSRWVLVAVLLVGGSAGWFALHAASERRHRAALGKAESELAAGRPGSARGIVQGLLADRADDGEALLLLGRCEEARGQSASALAAWERVPMHSPSFVPATVRRARVLLDAGRFAESEALLEPLASAVGPLDEGARQTLELLYRIEGRLHDVQRLIVGSWSGAADPSNVLRRLFLLDHFAYPATFIKDALARGSERDDRVRLGRANHAIAAGRFDEAEPWLAPCLEHRPDDPSAWRAALDLGVARDDPAAAWRAAEHLPAAALSEIERLRLRSWFAGRSGDARLERAALAALTESEPGNTGAWDRRAERSLAEGDATAAETFRKRKAQANANLARYKALVDTEPAARVRSAGELATLSAALGRPLEARGWALVRDGKARSEPLEPPEAVPAAPRTSTQVLAEVLAAVKPRSIREGPAPAAPARAVARFRDDAEASRLGFVYDNGHTGKFPPPPEAMGGGVGLLDFDGDGWIDVYLVQGGPFPAGQSAAQDGDRLFRNKGDGTFEDATARAGLAGMARGYGHGVTVGDFDNDGHPDLFVTRWRAYALYHNRGDGTFEDATIAAGLDGDRDWPTSAAFGDLDNDGDLDLYVCHYLAYDEKDPRRCAHPETALRRGCNPLDFEPMPDHVFRNDGGRFVDVTRAAGMAEASGRGLGVVINDLDGDGRVDVYVANDMSANFLYRNLGGFRFEEVGLRSGAASSAEGGFKAGMGVACGDLDGDGRIDLGVTNYYGESTTFYHNLGGGMFADHSESIGLAAPSRLLLGFGVAFLDVDNDGRLDVLSANGHVVDERPRIPWMMPLQLLQMGGDGRLRDVSDRAGAPFTPARLGRGFGVSDLDHDGLLDAVVVCQNEPVVYLHNETRTEPQDRGHFLLLLLEGTTSNRDAVGATVTARAGGRVWVASRFGGGNYQSASDPRIHVGLGAARSVDELKITWPSGRVRTFRDLPADTGYHLVEGESKPQPLRGFPR